MPLVRLQVRSVYSPGQNELHKNVDREDTKSILDGVAVSGLVGILRQLGDLTQFAVEIFQGIQEEVMITASRSNQLKMRLKQIEAKVPSIHKAVLAQTNHVHFAYTAGLEWHPRMPNVQNHFIYDDLPQFIMPPYDDCRDPPRLHLLDKFDINGPGSCLKRYTDPTLFKKLSRASILPETKKKKSLPRGLDISSVPSLTNHSDRKTFTSLSFSGRTTSTITDLQDHRSCSFDSKNGGDKLKGALYTSSRFTIASVLSESESEDAIECPSQDLKAPISWHEKAEIVECETDESPQVMHTNVIVDSKDETDSEGDDFVDALYTIDSESENEQTVDKANEKVQKKISNEITEERSKDSGYKSEELIHQDLWSASDISNHTHSYSNGFSNPLYDDTSCIQEHQETETSCEAECTTIWTNGNFLEVKPSKPVESMTEIDEDTSAPPFDWFASSPPLDHMKISFNHSETLPSSELKLKLREEFTFSSTFQLVPETTNATSLHDSESEKDTFCRSSSASYVSDNSEDNRSVSLSDKKWEEEKEASTFPRMETSNSHLVGNLSYLQNPAEPLPPPLPPLQWMVSRSEEKPLERIEENNKQSFKETLIRALEQRSSLSAVKKEETNIVTAYDPKPDNKVYQKNNVKDYKQNHVNAKEMEAGDFLHQIRTKQLNLRRVETTRASSRVATMNTNISMILEKANSIRQAVGSEDGDGESDTWSDSDNSRAY